VGREIELLMLDGSKLLARYDLYRHRNDHKIVLDSTLIMGTDRYQETALLFQLQQVMEALVDNASVRNQIFFVNFESFFRNTRSDDPLFSAFEDLLTKGVTIQMDELTEPFHYVPFEKSQSQAKECVISFVRKELFAPVRYRLDLGIRFGDWKNAALENAELASKYPAQLSKLYAYRGLYLSDATRIDGIETLLNEERIIVLDDEAIKKDGGHWRPEVFTVRTEKNYPAGKEVLLDEVTTESRNFQPIDQIYDGEGLISPYAAALINRGLYGDLFEMPDDDTQILQAMRQKRDLVDFSFQFRLPFCKGMLHTVDFHRFLKEIGAESYLIEDAFGIVRDLRKAVIILNKSVFKLCSLLGYDKSDWREMEDPMQYYFRKIREFRHSLYIEKTDRNFRSNGYTQLNYQFLNTLNLPAEDLNSLVQRHLQRAAQCRTSAIILNKGKLDFIRENPRESWVKYVTADYKLAVDPYVESLINSTRRAKLNELMKGHLDVEGEMRFLSRDLLHLLCCIARRIGADATEVKRFCLNPGVVYLPGKKDVHECAVFRSPHLSSNENVLAAVTSGSGWRKRYLGHLKRVAMVAAHSYIPNALGGADFDGDTVNVVFNKIVLKTCQGNSYCETKDRNGASLPFISIPSLKPEKSMGSLCVPAPFVDVKTIRSTFSSRVGAISNMALKIRAAEAVWQGPEKIPFTSALCTILTGAEIDAAKTGLRPDLSQIKAFINKPENDQAQKVIKAIGEYIEIINELEKVDMHKLRFEEKDGAIKVLCEDLEVAVIGHDPAAPQICQLLYIWAKACVADKAVDPERAKAAAELRAMIPSLKKAKTVPTKEVMTQLVFPKANDHPDKPIQGIFDQIWSGYTEAMKEYRSINLSRMTDQYMQCRTRSVMVLNLQYDNIDLQTEGQSIRTRSLRLFERIADKFCTEDDQSEALQSLFFPNNVENYWPFMNEESRIAMLNGKKFVDLPDRNLLANFREKGYMLLYYALRAAQRNYLMDKKISNIAEKKGEAYYARYCRILADAMMNQMSVSAAKRQVLNQCRQDLIDAAAECDITDTSDLFRLLYTPQESKNKMLWQIFAWDEIKVCIGDDGDVE
jgi:hypothetical protein